MDFIFMSTVGGRQMVRPPPRPFGTTFQALGLSGLHSVTPRAPFLPSSRHCFRAYALLLFFLAPLRSQWPRPSSSCGAIATK